jgi:hypothetical protein
VSFGFFNIKLYKIDIFVFSSNVAGLDTKDTILYSVAFGSVIVIGIVAGCPLDLHQGNAMSRRC